MCKLQEDEELILRLTEKCKLSTKDAKKLVKKWKINLYDKSSHSRWSISGIIYFAIVSNICTLITSIPENAKFKLYKNNLFNMLPDDHQHANYEIIPGLLYNLMHGIESTIKKIGILNLGMTFTTHKVYDLFKYFEKLFDAATKKIILDFKSKTISIIDFYYKGKYRKLKKAALDYKNIANKYPEKSYNPSEGSFLYDIDLINKIQEDVKFLANESINVEKEIWNKRMIPEDY